MNERIKQLYVCCLENKVIAFETNLLEFRNKVLETESKTKSYATFRRRFSESNEFIEVINGKSYSFQKLI